VATRDIEWPWEDVIDKKTPPENVNRRALPPNGIKYHYAPLGVLATAIGATFKSTDLRRRTFAPLGNV